MDTQVLVVIQELADLAVILVGVESVDTQALAVILAEVVSVVIQE